MSSSMSMSMSMSNVDSNVVSNVVSNVEAKVVSVRLSKLDLDFLGKKYNFEVEEALRYLSEEKSKKSKKSEKSKVLVAKYPMPFNGEKDEKCCNGVVKNHGLYTQCPKKVKGYCKSCEGQPYGNIDDRVKTGLYEYKDPKGKGPKRYLDVLKSLKILKETVEEETKRLNITINPIHFEEAAALENVKRGRPKTEKKVKEATGKKGRPKKEKKTVEVNEELEEEDLFATLIANAQKSQNVEAMVEEVVNEVVNLETDSLSNEETKEEVKPKKAKKVKEVDPAKEVEKQKKAEEKAAKDAAKEIEKQKKAEEKAAKDAAKEIEKQKKAEDKAAKEANKKKTKDLAPALSKVEEEADVVTKFDFGGKSYYKSKKSGVIYNMEQEVVGKWNTETNDIDFEEEEEEEEYDD
jgi:chemotaxis protein histidine kinase CheA